MRRIHVGSRVRVADATVLAAALRGPAEGRPEPGQMVWAGRGTSVTGYRRGTGDASLYDLKDAPGLWPEEWLDAV
jgi:L-aminopeptidase/D-esterase-like protein